MKLAVFDAAGVATQIIAGPEVHLVVNLWMLPADQQTRVLDATPYADVVSLLRLEEGEAGVRHVAALPPLADFDQVVAEASQ